MEFTSDISLVFVGYCFGSFAIGWASAFLIKFFKILGEKI